MEVGTWVGAGPELEDAVGQRTWGVVGALYWGEQAAGLGSSL